MPRRIHITRHLEGCTKHSTPKDAFKESFPRMHQKQHLEGCTSQGTSKGAQNTAPRRMHITKHIEGCTKHSTSKDANNKAPKRMHKTQHPEGCTHKRNPKDTQQEANTKAIAKVTFRQMSKTCYNEFLPDQLKYSATLHPGRARLKASQLINTIALFTFYSTGIFTNKI